MPKKRWNPRYEAYARAHGNTPDEQLEADERRMHGFMLWIRKQIQAWAEEVKHPRAKDPNKCLMGEAHDAFDKWLQDRDQELP